MKLARRAASMHLLVGTIVPVVITLFFNRFSDLKVFHFWRCHSIVGLVWFTNDR